MHGWRSWSLSSESFHNRSEALSTPRVWNYSVNVGPGGISRAVAQALQGSITATFTANLSVTLVSGGKLTLPVSGVFEGLSTSPVVRTRLPLPEGSAGRLKQL